MEKIMNRKDLTKYIFAFTLGDGYLSKVEKKENSFYGIKQVDTHKDYLEFQKEVLSSISDVKISYRNPYKDKRGFNVQGQFSLQTGRHPIYTKMRRRIYYNGIKSISYHDLKLFDWECLAIFFMDDGWMEKRKDGYKRIGIATHSFTFGDNILLKKAIEEKTGIRFGIFKHKLASGNYKFYLRTSKSESERFIEGVYPFLFKSFHYKITERLAPSN